VVTQPGVVSGAVAQVRIGMNKCPGQLRNRVDEPVLRLHCNRVRLPDVASTAISHSARSRWPIHRRCNAPTSTTPGVPRNVVSAKSARQRIVREVVQERRLDALPREQPVSESTKAAPTFRPRIPSVTAVNPT
jgi:hypothetical protein